MITDAQVRQVQESAAKRLGLSGPQRIRRAEVLATAKPMTVQTTPQKTVFDNHDLPPRFLRYELGDFSERLRNAAEAVLTNDDCWCVYVWGETGSRKTTFALAMLRWLRAKYKCERKTGEFVPAYQAVQVFRDFETSKPHIEKWQKAPWLVLDDLGKHRDTPHVIEQLLFLLHWRYDWARPKEKTIITANMSPNELAQRIDPATARRIEEGRIMHLTTKEAL